MPKKEKCLLNWNGAVESAVALFELKSPEYRLDGLVSRLDVTEKRILGQPISKSQVERQAQSLELPFSLITEAQWQRAEFASKKKNLDGVAFSSFSNADLRGQEEKTLALANLKAFYPLWGWDAKEVVRVFFSLGFKAIVTSVNLSKLPLPFVGREFDREFIEDLPSGVDPFGQNGEYGTFVYDGPFFQRKLEFKRDQVFEQNGFGIQRLDSL